MASDFFSQYPRLTLFSAIASIALSAWCVWADPIVNNDGVYYFRAAESIRLGNWDEAIAIYSWPFYPAFIAYLSKYTGVDVVGAAYVLNALLCALLVLGFVAAVHELGGKRDTLIIAALVILAFPTLNKYRPFIIRDVGYVAVYLWSLVYLFRYCTTKEVRNLVLWFLLTCLATLFRVEGIAMLVTIPIVVFSLGRVYSGYRWLVLAAYTTGGLLLLFVLGLWLGRDFAIVSITEGVVQPVEIWDKISAYISGVLELKLELLKEHLAGRYYIAVYVLIIIFVTLAEIVRRLAVVYALLALWGLKQGLLFPNMQLKPMWLALVLINILILIGSAIFITVVVDRYALTSTVTILLACPFVFAYFWRQWKRNELTARMKAMFAGLVIVCLLLAVRGLDVFTDKQYLYQAGRWIAENTPQESTLHSNNLILIYYSGKDAFHKPNRYTWATTYKLVKRKRWKQYDYLAIELSHADYPWIEWLEIHLHGQPIQRFSNKRGDSVLIYKNNS